MKKTRLLLLLALLLTAATGAWAQDAKHLITATHDEQTRSLEQPLPYATTIGELYEAVTGESFSSLISTMSLLDMPLSGISSTKTDVVSIGELNGASTPVTVKADGKATIGLRFGNFVKGIFVNVVSPLYAYVKDGVKDADKWTVKVGEGQAQALPIGGLKGDGSETVTLQYNGRLKVKGVTATTDAAAAAGNTVDLSTLTADYEAQDGDVLTGSTTSYKVTIADGATVTLDGVTIEGVNSDWYPFAALTCVGDATIILKEGSTNKLKGFQSGYPGIFVPEGKTLTIQGSGSLDASAEGAAGIGGGYAKHCGNITIEGGTITATGAYGAAGIGGGWKGNCGNITIKKTVTSVTATKGYGANSIGAGKEGSCGTVTIEEGANVTQN